MTDNVCGICGDIDCGISGFRPPPPPPSAEEVRKMLAFQRRMDDRLRAYVRGLEAGR